MLYPMKYAISSHDLSVSPHSSVSPNEYDPIFWQKMGAELRELCFVGGDMPVEHFYVVVLRHCPKLEHLGFSGMAGKFSGAEFRIARSSFIQNELFVLHGRGTIN